MLRVFVQRLQNLHHSIFLSSINFSQTGWPSSWEIGWASAAGGTPRIAWLIASISTVAAISTVASLVAALVAVAISSVLLVPSLVSLVFPLVFTIWRTRGSCGSRQLSKMAKVGWGSFGIPGIAGSGPADCPRGDLGEMVIPSKGQDVVPSDLLTLHMVELILVVQARESLNFIVDLGEHDEEAAGALLVVRAAFGEVATNIFVHARVVVIGCYKLSNLNYHAIAKGFHIHIRKLTGQEIAKKVELGLMSVQGPGTFLLEKLEEAVNKGVIVIGA